MSHKILLFTALFGLLVLVPGGSGTAFSDQESPSDDPFASAAAPDTVTPDTSEQPQQEPVGVEVAPEHPSFIVSEPRPVPPFPIVLNQAVQHFVSQILEQPYALRASFQRSQPFLSQMMRELRGRGLPDDLVYLAFAESYFSKRGKGPWQFGKATARRFGLHINSFVDERRDPILSTRAAAEYLANLHDQAGSDWRVAVVGWNAGEGSIERYWQLRGDPNYNRFVDQLPRRTRQLLCRFMAVAFVARNAAAYGLGPVSYDDSPAYREVKYRGGTLLTWIAKVESTTVAALRELNPGLLRDRLPPDWHAYSVRVPLAGNFARFSER
jgi:peptidoglycan lytic transglycosylase D